MKVTFTIVENETGWDFHNHRDYPDTDASMEDIKEDAKFICVQTDRGVKIDIDGVPYMACWVIDTLQFGKIDSDDIMRDYECLATHE
jgi:hypothetical protein